jgi:hypothetical protein
MVFSSAAVEASVLITFDLKKYYLNLGRYSFRFAKETGLAPPIPL